MEGKVPTPNGNISIKVTKKQITVTGAAGVGVLRFSSERKPWTKVGIIKKTGFNLYELKIEPGNEYLVNYFLPKKNNP